MTEQEVWRNIRLYRWMQLLRDPLFWGPLIIHFIQKSGHMNLDQIYFMESIVVLGSVILQIPTGALADLIGRKKTVVLGSLLNLACVVLFATANSPLTIWVANIIWMLGLSLCSGADSAFLYDTLKEAGIENRYKEIEGKALANRLLLIAFSSLMAGHLGEINLRLPMLLSIPGVLVAFTVTCLFHEPVKIKKYTPKEQLNLMKFSVLFVANHKAVKWIICFSALINTASKVWFFTYNPYFELTGMPLKYYGYIFCAINIVAMFFSRYANYFEKKLGEYSSIVGMVGLIGLPIILMGSFVHIFANGFVVLQNVVRGYMQPFLGHFLNRHLDSENRATVISIRAAFLGLTEFISLGLFGWLLKIYSLPSCLQLLGLSTLIIGFMLITRYKTIFTQE